MAYTDEELVAAVQAVLDGEKMAFTCARTGIPVSALKKWVAAARAGQPVERRRRGPPPLLTEEAEKSIEEWVLGRQLVGCPVDRQMVLKKAREVSLLVAEVTVGEGWYHRFLQRHPKLCIRRSQSAAQVSNAVDTTDLATLLGSLAKMIIENKMGALRIFNVDETAFETSEKASKVLVAQGSKNVWHTNTHINFHLSIVACASAAGFVVPPLFIFPGDRVELQMLQDCAIPGAAVTTTEKAFMNAWLFEQWLPVFANAVPTPIKRPLLLVMDGCASHYSKKIVATAEHHGILLVCLPANGTHLLKPLDVAVFSSFKAKLKLLVQELCRDNAEVNASKATAVRLASLAWEACNFGKNITSGFESCGMYPLSLVRMQNKLANFQRNGTPTEVQRAKWLRVKHVVQQDILVLPAPVRKRKQRKTVIVAVVC